MSGVEILDWRAMAKGSLLGFAKVGMPSGLILNDVTILTGDRGPWASPPGKPMIGRDGTALTDGKGKVKYTPVVEFTSKDSRDRFSAAVIEAMRQAHPEVIA